MSTSHRGGSEDVPDHETTSRHRTAASVLVALGRIELRLDQLLADRADHEERIRELEDAPNVTTKMMAGWVVVATALATAIPFFTGSSGHHWGNR
jgi:hypothetical protein